MNNEELKKKIVEVLVPVVKSGNISCNEENACKRCWFPCEIERTAGRLADALIAAGIGDVKTIQEIATSATAMAVLEAAQAEHRAEVSERALFDLALYCAKTVSPDYVRNTSEENQIEYAKAICKEWRAQAEKELAEERKDEQD